MDLAGRALGLLLTASPLLVALPAGAWSARKPAPVVRSSPSRSRPAAEEPLAQRVASALRQPRAAVLLQLLRQAAAARETELAGQSVYLYRLVGSAYVPLGSTTTLAGGSYSFVGLPNGSYKEGITTQLACRNNARSSSSGIGRASRKPWT